MITLEQLFKQNMVNLSISLDRIATLYDNENRY